MSEIIEIISSVRAKHIGQIQPAKTLQEYMLAVENHDSDYKYLKYLIKTHQIVSIVKTLEMISFYGWRKLLILMRLENLIENYQASVHMTTFAIYGDQLDFLRFLHQRGIKYSEHDYLNALGGFFYNLSYKEVIAQLEFRSDRIEFFLLSRAERIPNFELIEEIYDNLPSYDYNIPKMIRMVDRQVNKILSSWYFTRHLLIVNRGRWSALFYQKIRKTGDHYAAQYMAKNINHWRKS